MNSIGPIIEKVFSLVDCSNAGIQAVNLCDSDATQILGLNISALSCIADGKIVKADALLEKARSQTSGETSSRSL